MPSLPIRLLALALPLLALVTADDAKDLKSKDPLVRLEVVERLAADGGEDAGKLLTKALEDDDWEVATRAAEGLADHADAKAIKPLAKAAWEGRVAPLRLAAAHAAARLDADKALAELAKKMTGDRVQRTCEAWAAIVHAARETDPGFTPKVPKAMARGLKSKDSRARAAAAYALVLCTRADGKDGRAELLAELVESEHTALACAALDAARDDPVATQVPALEALLRRPSLIDVIERRALGAMAASLGLLEEDAAVGSPAAVVGRLAAGITVDLAEVDEDEPIPTEPRVAARGARLAELAAEAGALSPAELAAALEPALAKSRTGPRAAAARALRHGERETALPRLRGLVDARGDAQGDARVRRAALASALAMAPLLVAEAPEAKGNEPAGEPTFDEEQVAWVASLLAEESDAELRIELAVALGVEGLEDAIEPLGRALEDSDWRVAACAAVSLGRTRGELALEPLVDLTTSTDWRRRGAAVMGLAHLMMKEGVAPVIALLEDPEPLVVRTAHAFLRSINRGAPLPPDVAPWSDWWSGAEKRTRLETPREARERREKLGYAATPTEIYAGLDVVVLQSRGDHMETVLDFLGIVHRRTAAGGVPHIGLDGGGVFVANCAGEIQAGDVERLRWFVHVGGYLFSSCWAVTETVGRVAPGNLRKLETRGEVLDQVTAAPCDPGSPYLDGVFAPGVVPIYHLVGAHLIDVTAPERVEVLVDSPECAERWGGGNLAAWFRTGHGRILDSVNHFDAQGLAEALGLKSEEDRRAFAMDHMGITFTRLRATDGEKWWSSSPKAAEHVRDLSAFSLITNFVRARRLQGY